MAEKVIEGKKFKVEETLYTTRTIGRENAGKFLPPEGENNSPIIVSAQITKEQYDTLIDFKSPLAYQRNGEYYFDVAEVKGNNIKALRTEGEDSTSLEQIRQNAIEDSKLSVEASGLTNGSNTQPNVASTNTQTQEVSSTPVATGLGVQFGSAPDLSGESPIRKYPLNISDDQDCMEFTVFEYADRDITKAGNNLTPFQSTGGGKIDEGFKQITKQGYVYLPITKISDTNSVNWNEDSLNEFQRYLANVSLETMQAGTYNGPDAAGQPLRQGIGDLTQFAINNPGFGNYIRSLLAGQAVGVGNLVTRSTGAILNPNMELLFNNPTLRQFQFSFDLIAKNSGEATIIKSIIKFFKQNMAVRETPTEIGGLDTPGGTGGNSIGEGSSVFLNSPYVFRIKYLSGFRNKTQKDFHQSIGKIKMCALQSFTTDYTPMGSFMSFNDEARTMFMYRLSMSFKELTPIYNTDYTDHPIGF
jgi:hypothetical protein